MSRPNVIIVKAKDYYQCTIARRNLSGFEKRGLSQLREFVAEKHQVLLLLQQPNCRAWTGRWNDLKKILDRSELLKSFVLDGEKVVSDAKTLIELLPFKNPYEFKSWIERLTAYVKWSDGFAMALKYLEQSDDDFPHLIADDDDDDGGGGGDEATITLHYPTYFKRTCRCIVDSLMISYWT